MDSLSAKRKLLKNWLRYFVRHLISVMSMSRRCNTVDIYIECLKSPLCYRMVCFINHIMATSWLPNFISLMLIRLNCKLKVVLTGSHLWPRSDAKQQILICIETWFWVEISVLGKLTWVKSWSVWGMWEPCTPPVPRSPLALCGAGQGTPPVPTESPGPLRGGAGDSACPHRVPWPSAGRGRGSMHLLTSPM